MCPVEEAVLSFCVLLSLSPFKGVAAFGVTLGKEDLLQARPESR